MAWPKSQRRRSIIDIEKLRLKGLTTLLKKTLRDDAGKVVRRKFPAVLEKNIDLSAHSKNKFRTFRPTNKNGNFGRLFNKRSSVNLKILLL